MCAYNRGCLFQEGLANKSFRNGADKNDFETTIRDTV